ncbi:MAG: histidinol dehydrogenase [Desulfohalobiaceae bacterium]|nr:histidinol dehydrogenase [Desulfohalobiaceae bacterium]
MHESLLPDWAQQFLISEELFTTAYAQLGLQEKTRLKKCIASLQTWYDHTRVQSLGTQTDFAQGLQVWTRERPRDWMLVHIDAHAASPAVLLATILPPVLAGVSEVVVCSQRGSLPYPNSFLTACELSGMETILSLPESGLPDLLQAMHRRSSSGALLALQAASPAHDSSDMERDTRSPVPAYRLQGPRTAGLWVDAAQDWDFEALRFAHPELEIEIWSEQSLELPGSWPRQCGPFQDFRQAGFDALFVPLRHVQASMGWAPVVLGPGQEGSWVWPEFCWRMCMSKQLAWFDSGRQEASFPEPE